MSAAETWNFARAHPHPAASAWTLPAALVFPPFCGRDSFQRIPVGEREDGRRPRVCGSTCTAGAQVAVLDNRRVRRGSRQCRSRHLWRLFSPRVIETRLKRNQSRLFGADVLVELVISRGRRRGAAQPLTGSKAFAGGVSFEDLRRNFIDVPGVMNEPFQKHSRKKVLFFRLAFTRQEKRVSAQ